MGDNDRDIPRDIAKKATTRLGLDRSLHGLLIESLCCTAQGADRHNLIV